MDKHNFDNRFNRVKGDAKLYKKLIAWMLGANILLVLALMYTVFNEKIILVPEASPEDKIWVSHSQVSSEYLSLLSRNLISQLLDVSPANVEAQHREILKYVAPKYTDLIKTQLDQLDKTIRQNNISQTFFVSNIKIIRGKNIVYLNGSLNEYIDKSLASSAFQIYRLTYTVKNYGVKLANFELVKKGDQQLKDLGS